MNITTITQDTARVKTLLESGNKKALENMLLPFHKAYIEQITSKLDPWEQQKYLDMFQ